MAKFVKVLAALIVLVGFGGWLTGAASSLILDGASAAAGADPGGGEAAGLLRGALEALFTAVYGTSRGEDLGPLGAAIFFACVVVGAIVRNLADALADDDRAEECDATGA